jgi:hypothetical protein
MLKYNGAIHSWALDWISVDGYRAAVVWQKSGYDAHQGSLTAAAWSDDGHELAVANRKGNVNKRRHFARFAIQPVLLRDVID